MLIPLLPVILAFAASAPRTAFREVLPARRAPPEMMDRTVRHLRAVEPVGHLFDAPAMARFEAAESARDLKLLMFPGTNLVAHWISVMRNEQGGIVWTGTVEGAKYGQAVLIFSAGAITANVTRGDGMLYQLRTAKDGTLWLREIDQSRFPADR